MRIYQAGMLGLIVWYLILPAMAEDSGTRRTEPMNVLLGSYNSRAECEQELRGLLKDPTIASKVKSAKCMPSTKMDSPSERGH